MATSQPKRTFICVPVVSQNTLEGLKYLLKPAGTNFATVKIPQSINAMERKLVILLLNAVCKGQKTDFPEGLTFF